MGERRVGEKGGSTLPSLERIPVFQLIYASKDEQTNDIQQSLSDLKETDKNIISQFLIVFPSSSSVINCVYCRSLPISGLSINRK